jgi:hypothetical protein
MSLLFADRFSPELAKAMPVIFGRRLYVEAASSPPYASHAVRSNSISRFVASCGHILLVRVVASLTTKLLFAEIAGLKPKPASY